MYPCTPKGRTVFGTTKVSILENSDVVATEPSSDASIGLVKVTKVVQIIKCT